MTARSRAKTKGDAPTRSERGRAANAAGAAWERSVILLAHMYGWTVAAFRSVLIKRQDGSCYYATPVQADGEGWPDHVLLRGDRILYRELKTDGARVSDKQLRWHERLRAAGADVGVWRPKDIQQITAELRR